MLVEDLINKLLCRKDLCVSETEFMMLEMLNGKLDSAQMAAFLVALKMKGETGDEILGLVQAMRQKSKTIEINDGAELLDTCGTGGDGKNTFNVSTAVAFVAAAGGVKVAKHGNRSITSKCGSADVLEELGININMEPTDTVNSLEKIGIGFMFAQDYHKAMKNVAEVRKSLKTKTVFNILGPLSNPAKASRQLVGVYSVEIADLVIETLRRMDLKQACVVHSRDGLDEISISDTTYISELRAGAIKKYEFDPASFGLNYSSLDEIKGGCSATNAAIIRGVFSGKTGPCRNIVVLNSAFALYVGGIAKNPREGFELAKKIIDSGRAMEKLDQLVRFSKKELACHVG